MTAERLYRLVLGRGRALQPEPYMLGRIVHKVSYCHRSGTAQVQCLSGCTDTVDNECLEAL